MSQLRLGGPVWGQLLAGVHRTALPPAKLRLNGMPAASLLPVLAHLPPLSPSACSTAAPACPRLPRSEAQRQEAAAFLLPLLEAECFEAVQVGGAVTSGGAARLWGVQGRGGWLGGSNLEAGQKQNEAVQVGSGRWVMAGGAGSQSLRSPLLRPL